MIFTSIPFLWFFLVILIGLCVLQRRDHRQALILAGSIFFYAQSRLSHLLILAAPSLIDYVCAKRIEDAVRQSARKRWLLASLTTNLGLLAYFKYANFFIANVSALWPAPIGSLDVILPVGISFFTFKTLSYTVDVYRGELAACRSLWKYALFVAYFPELVAGPIVRASVFLPQMTRTLKPSWHRASIGAQLILLGITKKVVFADRLAAFVDPVFRMASAYSPATVTLSVIAYSIQIYCDFSGYSDMAIGISKIIGFDLPENFDMPYLSVSITEFWRRWHMTLSRWLRDYLYIPLGGNRRSRIRTYVNLFITMFLGGLWHGANWTFVFWGCLHGAGLVVHKMWRELHPCTGRSSVPGRILSWVATYCFVCVGWVFFRAGSFAQAMVILRKIGWIDRQGVDWIYSPLLMLLPFFVAAHLFGALTAAYFPAGARSAAPCARWQWLYSGTTKPRFALRPHKAAGIYLLLPLQNAIGVFIVSTWSLLDVLFASTQTIPFIYFQF